MRLIYYLFFKNLGIKNLLNLIEGFGIYFPIGFLFAFSVAAGSFIGWYYFPVVTIYIALILKVLVIISLTFFFILTFFSVNIFEISLLKIRNSIITFIGSIWFLPLVSSIFFMPITKLGVLTIKFFDQGWLEQIGGQGFIKQIKFYSSSLDFFTGLNVKNYLLLFFFYIIFFYNFVVFK